MSTYRGSTPVRSENSDDSFQAITIKRSQYVSFTASAKESAVLDDETSLVRVFATQDCWISVISSGGTAAAAPVAEKTIVSNVKRLRGGLVDFIGVPENLTNAVISVISDGTSGTIDIEEAN